MKDHKQVRTFVHIEGPLDDAITALREYAGEMKEPRVVVEYYDDGSEHYIEGWVPMTDAEKESAKEERKKARVARKRALEEQKVRERLMLEDLARRHNVKLVDEHEE